MDRSNESQQYEARIAARAVEAATNTTDADLRYSCARVIQDDTGQQPDEQVDHLVIAVRRYLTTFGVRALAAMRGFDQSADGGFWLDGVLADIVAGTGESGRAAAAAIREQSRRKWQEFTRTKDAEKLFGQYRALLASRIALPVWHDIVKHETRAIVAAPAPEPTRESAPLAVEDEDEVVDRLITPALPAPFHEAARNAFFAKTRAVTNGGEVKARGEVVAVLEAPVGTEVPEDIGKLLKATRSKAGHLLVRWIVWKVFAQKSAGIEPCTRIRIEGGFQQIAAELGFRGGKAADDVRKALTLMRLSTLVVRGVRFHGLCLWSERGAAPGRKSLINITVADWARPGFVRALAKSEREMRTLVPLPMELPLFVGHESHHPSQAELQFSLLAELRHRAKELADRGSVALSSEDWARLASDVELPADLLPAVIEAWKSGGEDDDANIVPAFITEPEPGRFSLAETYDSERRLLTEAGEKSARGLQRRLGRRTSRRA